MNGDLPSGTPTRVIDVGRITMDVNANRLEEAFEQADAALASLNIRMSLFVPKTVPVAERQACRHDFERALEALHTIRSILDPQET